jgi:hypothetical protein
MSDTIEVGADGGDFRLYKAKAIREAGETYLLGQERSYAATEARATNLLGWATAGVVALASRMLVAGFDGPLFVAMVFLFFSAICSCSVLWPGKWHPAGFPPGELRGWREETELEFQEHLASAYAGAIQINRTTAQRACRKMRAAWVLAFSATPAAALMYLVSHCSYVVN